MSVTMATFSINLSPELAKLSQEFARRLNLTRADLIRQALKHELDHLRKQFEQEAIVRSIQAMKKSEDYMAESKAIEESLNSVIPKEKEKWWKTS